jgi:hypothetical protein
MSFSVVPLRVALAAGSAAEGSQLFAGHGIADLTARRAADPAAGPARRGGRPTVALRSTEQGGIPGGLLGTWRGQVALPGGLTEKFVLELTQPGVAGSSAAVGTFRNQTVSCDGNVFLEPASGGTVVELSLTTTEDPLHACPAAMEADVQLAKGGAALDYEVIAVDTVQGTPQNPLAQGSLYR